MFSRGNDVDGASTLNESDHSKPIADLFLDCTVFFADIVGFTSWSSVCVFLVETDCFTSLSSTKTNCTIIILFAFSDDRRDPTQVFTLLEAVYNSFDAIARKRNVFKVETIGDCYVGKFALRDKNLHSARNLSDIYYPSRS
jgi:Adenylate and Guanylate cyclase catalytic domain